MTEEQYRLNKWGTKLLKNNRPLLDWVNEADDIVDLLNELDKQFVDEFSLCETLQFELQRVEKENEQLKEINQELYDKLQITMSYKSLKMGENSILERENEQLKQQLADIDSLIYDLGHDEMRRQYEEIFKGDVE